MTDPVEAVARALKRIEFERAGIVAEMDFRIDMEWPLAVPEARAAITALEDAGFVVVPREASPDMLRKFNEWRNQAFPVILPEDYYRVLVAAAQKPHEA